MSRTEATSEDHLKNIFVGNLSSNLTPDELRTVFQSYGEVNEIEIVTDADTGYSRGFAFVGMRDDLEAARAIANLNGTTLWGNSVSVEEARPKLQRGKPPTVSGSGG